MIFILFCESKILFLNYNINILTGINTYVKCFLRHKLLNLDFLLKCHQFTMYVFTIEYLDILILFAFV